MDFFVLIFLAHVYNVCKQEGQLAEDWADLEMLISLCGETPFFKGPRTTKASRQRYFGRVVYMFNVPVNTCVKLFFEKGRLPKIAQAEAVPIQPLAWPLASALTHRLRYQDNSEGSSTEVIKLILKALNAQTLAGNASQPIDMECGGVLNISKELLHWARHTPSSSTATTMALLRHQRSSHSNPDTVS